MKNLISSKLFIIVGAALIGLSLFLTNKTQAQNSTTPFTGGCGSIFKTESIYDVLWEYTKNSLDQEGGSVMMSMNFDTRKADIVAQQLNINLVDGRGFGLSLPPRPGQLKTWEIEIASAISFNIEPFAGVSGAYLTTLQSPFPGEKDITFLLMPVNGGNSFLIQGKSFSGTGVCQKF